MAENYSVFNPTVDLNPYTNEIAEIQRRQRMAQLLQQQGMEPIESQMVSGRVIRTSPWQVLAKALQTGMGAYQESQANKAAADLREQMAYDQRQKEADVASAGQAMMGRMYGERPTQYDKNGLPIGREPYTPPDLTPDEMGNTPRAPKPITLQPGQAESGSRNRSFAQSISEGDQLGEITPTAKYQYDPSGAFQMAMTPAGTEAMKGNPLMASLLAQMVKPKEPEKFGTTPVRGADGKYYLVSESGRMVPTNVAGFDKETTQTNLGKLYAERDALLPNDPRRKEYDKAIANALQPNTGTNINFGGLVTAKDAAGNPVLLQPSSQGGVRKVEGFTPATPSGDSSVDIRKHRESKLELQNAMDVVTKFNQSLSSIPKEESIVGAKAGELASNYKLALGAIRKLQNTGVLNPGELPFIEDTLRNPQSISQLFNPQSRKEIEGQIRAITSALELQNKNLDESYSYDYRPLKGSRSTW